MLSAGVCIVMLAMEFVRVFRAGENMAAPAFGTAAAPYSDALGPWLEGGLTLLFGLPPPTYLYRPTIGVFWSAILAATGRVDAIPTFFCAWFFALVIAVLVIARRDSALVHATLAWLAISVLAFAQTLQTLYIATTNVDLAAFVFTASGVLLLVARCGERTGLNLVLLSAAACLGIAAAIRGPMLIAGPVIIALHILVGRDHRTVKSVAAALAFATPVVVDVVLQRHFGVVNNGILALYCVYSDPAHTWTAACHQAYLVQHPSAAGVLRDYIAFAGSSLGMTHLLAAAANRAMRDLQLMQQLAAIGILLGVCALHALARRRTDDTPPTRESARSAALPLRFVVVTATLMLARYLQADHFTSDLAWLIAGTLSAAWLRLWRALICLLSYLLAMAFLCLMGMQGGDRLVATFSFTLYVGVALLVLDRPPSPALATPPAGTRSWQAVAVVLIAAMAFLYLGNHILPSELRTRYRNDVEAKPGVALKISDDPRIDRSLYYTGHRQIIYTRHDDLPVGSIRRYRQLLNGESANGSFVKPNALLD
ncbi:MAG TPA: hypothetical protein VFB54_03755 [Burkholderiales bacterium]|nr:hypothetical protein [Burkholderiales bacterium]